MRTSTMFSLCYSTTFKATSHSSAFPSSLHSLTSAFFPLQPKSRNFVSLKESSFPGNSIPTKRRSLCVVSGSKSDDGFHESSFEGAESFFRSVMASMETVYLNRNPTAKAILELVQSVDGEQICYDHLAFRTFGVNGYGIDSMAKFFLDFGYTPREELRFPAKKLKALWFSPPSVPLLDGDSGVNGPLPRVFISELLVDQMSAQTQDIIRKYTEISGGANKHAALASAIGSLTWGKPLYSEFQQLARESEYAAWTLVNGYALNHATISTHRLKSHLRNIKSLNQFIEDNGFKLNSQGGVLKVSPDGLLLQSSTVADSVSFQFSDGVTESVPCSYIEFAERLVLPQYKNISEGEVKEFHRRDGFEVGNADKIFESTSMEQLTRKAA
ncbi:2-oxoadipate dioxygenase/decarboxylase, chloroplastic [Alnus glutinosa]|uniref:2-oxoadipate dioxygenase/decarboxylase, chloroplastic n=1 Tax=Alnus glutinosa TaxID=3517 RepID=UPI002D795FDA|nr:2-oxoadipate dioxygenase/decarboxylase, chloroplastic [Alnus glutinosa]